MPRFTVPVVVMLAALGSAWSCVESDGSECPGCPPPIGTPRDAGILDVPAQPDIVGPCPGQGTVSVTFDRGKASQTCWSASSPLVMTGATLPPGQPAVTIAGEPQSYPGLFVGILLYSGESRGKSCGVAPGSKLALDEPCVSVTVGYGSGGGKTEWAAFGGAASLAARPGDASVAMAEGSVVVGSFGTTLGSPVSVSFAPGSALILDAPGHPLVPISGSLSVPLQ